MPVSHFRLLLLVLPLLTMAASAATHDLPDGASVRIQSSELGPGWYMGTVQNTKDGCARVWNPVPEAAGGRRGLVLMLIQKLERQEGTKWIDMPVVLMVQKEPKLCQEGAGDYNRDGPKIYFAARLAPTYLLRR